MAKILILYSTVDGHTRQICERLQEIVGQEGHEVVVEMLADMSAEQLDAFDKVVIGASIRYGKHRPQVTEFMNAHRQTLDAKPNAFFTVNAVARKPEKNRPETNPYLQKFLKQLTWTPAELDVFAGKIEYRKYGFVDKQMIRFIMWITKGPTDPDAVVEFTDWGRVEEFGKRIATM